MNMRRSLLGEDHPKHIRPLNDAKAIDSGANFISEGFLFSFATLLILAETWRSRRNTNARRDLVSDTLEAHEVELQSLKESLEQEKVARAETLARERQLEVLVEEIVGIGLRGGWLEAPSPSWQSHVRLGDEARVAAGRSSLPVALDAEVARDGAERELGGAFIEETLPRRKAVEGDRK